MRREASLALAAAIALAAACRTAPPPPPSAPLEQGVAALTRPLPGDLAALYRLRVAATGTLRLTALTAGTAGRLSISEPFAGAVSVAAWDGDGDAARLYDLREGCRVEAESLAAVLGIGRLPLPQAVRLLAGRLPVAGGAARVESDSGQAVVSGDTWGYRADLAADPWRVVRVTGEGWSVTLDRHTLSVPGRLRLEHADGRWAELELVRLEWPEDPTLPDEPDLPPCAVAGGGAR